MKTLINKIKEHKVIKLKKFYELAETTNNQLPIEHSAKKIGDIIQALNLYYTLLVKLEETDDIDAFIATYKQYFNTVKLKSIKNDENALNSLIEQLDELEAVLLSKINKDALEPPKQDDKNTVTRTGRLVDAKEEESQEPDEFDVGDGEKLELDFDEDSEPEIALNASSKNTEYNQTISERIRDFLASDRVKNQQ